jgi:hypothetical protein
MTPATVPALLDVMNAEERIERHRRMVEGYLHALTVGPELDRIEFPPEWVVHPDAIQWLPSVNGGEEHQLGKYLTDNNLTHSDRGTAEFQKFWKHLPDFGVVAHGAPIVDGGGFAVWIRMEGTALDGTKYGMTEFDTVRTDADGAIVRYEAMFDMSELTPLLQLVAGLSSDMSWDEWREAMK